MRTLILGLGNPLRCDDGVGIRVVESLREKEIPAGVEVLEATVSGFDLLEIITGYDRVLIIDAIQTPKGEPGQLYRLGLEDLATSSMPSLTHGIDLATAVEFGRQLGLPLPEEIVIFAIEAQDVTTFSEDCTPMVKKVIPKVVELVLSELKQ